MTLTRRPPGPKNAALLRTLAAYSRDPFATLTELAREYGDLVSFGLTPLNTYLINRPAYIESVLVTDDSRFEPVRPYTVGRAMRDGLFTSGGTLHDRQRALIAPAFDHGRVEALAGAVSAVAARFHGRWEDGAVLDLEAELERLIVRLSAETIFGDDTATHAPALVGPALAVNQYLGTRSTNPLSAAGELLPLSPANRRFWRAFHRLDGAIHDLIAERRARDGQGDDLLGFLMQARDEGDGRGMSDRQLRDEVISLYTTGNAVTARGVMWTLYLLAQYPDAEATLHGELRRVLAGRLATAADYPRLTYTRMAISESLRLYPPAWTVGRRARAEYQLDGQLLPAGSILVLSPYVTQRDPRFFPDPLRFDPDRWTPAAAAARPPFSYFPFSGGPRGCLGEPLAWLEMVLVLATLAQHWRFRPLPGYPLLLEPLLALRPKYGMPVQLERR